VRAGGSRAQVLRCNCVSVKRESEGALATAPVGFFAGVPPLSSSQHT
jgi:hypothetical protein